MGPSGEADHLRWYYLENPRVDLDLVYVAEVAGMARSTARVVPLQIYAVMADLDLPRPAPQRGKGDFEPFSIENLSNHDADVMLVVNYSEEGQDPNFRALVGSPLYGSLAAREAGQAYVIDGTRTVGAAWARM